MTQPLHALIHKGIVVFCMKLLFFYMKSAFECFWNAELPEIIKNCEETQWKLLYMIVLFI